jgi:hypothetical protein
MHRSPPPQVGVTGEGSTVGTWEHAKKQRNETAQRKRKNNRARLVGSQAEPE